MTSEELKEELKKQIEKEKYEEMVTEYLRVKTLVAQSGMLTHDEAREIALRVCSARNVFDMRSAW